MSDDQVQRSLDDCEREIDELQAKTEYLTVALASFARVLVQTRVISEAESAAALAHAEAQMHALLQRTAEARDSQRRSRAIHTRPPTGGDGKPH